MSRETRGPVGIVGAGPAGLCAAAALRARGVPFEMLDQGPDVGGIWDIDRPVTPMYESAHFISSRTLSAFPDFPMPAEFPDYPRHDRILEYIRAFADHHDLRRHARFGVSVVRAVRRPAGGWDLELDTGERRTYEALVVATGVNWHPSIPDVEGHFAGEAYHAFSYRSADAFRGKRVLVVGAGNSGCDIACDAARVADRAWISMRRGYHFVPKYVFGRPSDVFAQSGPPLPAWLERRVFGFLLRHLVVGDVTRFGLPRPDHAILESHPIMNTRLLDHLGHGDIEVRADVDELRGNSVRFADGREEEVDVIVWATGYLRHHPFLSEVELDRRDGELDLYLELAHRRFDDLFFMGQFETDGAAYPLFGLQARLVAAALTLPAGAATDQWHHRRTRDRPDLRGGRRYLDTPRHRHYVHRDTYLKTLSHEVEVLESRL